MKKNLKIIIPVAIVVVLAIVGTIIFKSNSNKDNIAVTSDKVEEKKEEKKVKELQIGEAYTSLKDYEFTLKEVNSATGNKCFDSTMNDKDFLKSKAKATSYDFKPAKGKAIISLSYTVKYSGKAKTNFQCPKWELDYNNGYKIKFESDVYSDYPSDINYWDGSTWKRSSIGNRIISFEPLVSDKVEIREGYISVPEEVINNKELPLKINMITSTGAIMCTYNIR